MCDILKMALSPDQFAQLAELIRTAVPSTQNANVAATQRAWQHAMAGGHAAAQPVDSPPPGIDGGASGPEYHRGFISGKG